MKITCEHCGEPADDAVEETLVISLDLMEKLIGSKSSDYNKGVQDCINLFKYKI